MKNFEEIANEVIWQNEMICKENAVLAVKIAFREFLIATSDKMAKEDVNAANILYRKANEVFDLMETETA